jgi:hypothetical protein
VLPPPPPELQAPTRKQRRDAKGDNQPRKDIEYVFRKRKSQGKNGSFNDE